jgi:hypothetical protein
MRKGLSRGERVRIKTPWGMWRCADGLEVLFNLQRWPILQRYPGGQTTGCDPNKTFEFECEAFFVERFQRQRSPSLSSSRQNMTVP